MAGSPAATVYDTPDLFGFGVALADYNGDGYADLAASAPGAPVTANSVKREDAGTINLIYGSATGLTTSGNKQLTQASTGVPGFHERNDWFGAELAGGDANGDGRSELAAFSPGDETVTMIPGAPRYAAVTGAVAWSQDSSGVTGTPEFEDFFGESLRFGYFRGGPYAGLAIGIPGEDNGAGAVQLLYGSGTGLTATGTKYFTQNTPGIHELSQPGDWFGYF